MITNIPNKFKLFIVSVLLLLTRSQIGYSQTVQTFTTVGTQTWTCPAGITTVTVECYGGGGGGGGASASLNAAGGGGGGGAYASSVISVVPGTTYTIIVGANGLGGASSGTSGSNGGSSSFNTNLVLAAGGLGGLGSTSSTSLGAGGAGGSVASSIGTIKYAGGSGAAGILNLSGGGGGSSAGNALNGNNASSSTGGTAPAGGVSGASASTVVTGASGTNGLNFGGGASGAHCGTSLIGYPGGNAGMGKVILSYVCTPPTILASANPTLVCPGSTSTLTASGPLTLDQQSTTGTTTGFWMSLSGQQTFIAGYTGILKKVRIHTATYASATNVTVNIMSGTPGSGTLLANVVYFKGANQNSWDDVIMPGSGVALSSGSPYYIEILGGSQVDWIYTNANPYPNGMSWRGGTSYTSNDYNFETYMDLNTYMWNPGSISQQTFTSNPASTTNYTVTVTNTAGCSATQLVVLNVNPALTTTFTQTNVLCNAGNTGAINLTVTGGTPITGLPTLDQQQTSASCGTSFNDFWQSFTSSVTGLFYSIDVSILMNSPTVGNWYVYSGSGTGGALLASGSYNFSALGGSQWQNIVITGSPLLLSGQQYTFRMSNADWNQACGGNVYSGGTDNFGNDRGFRTYMQPAPYNYSWSNGATTEDISALTAGGYTVTLSDSKGCSIISNTTITQPTALSAATTVTNVSCFGGNNGAINLTPTGGTTPYTFNWGSGITTEDRTGLVAGVYTCTITDVNGCLTTKTATITQPASVLAGSTVVANVSCFGGNNGAINLTPTGGTTPYIFNWGSGITTEDRTGLVAGVYTCTITDVNACLTTVTATVTQPAALLTGSTVVTNVSCFGGNNGTINLTPTGGTTPYTFNWGGGITTEDRTGLVVGAYTCTITDVNTCSVSISATVTQPTALSAATTVTNVSCFGGNNGAINLTPTGGSAPYTFNWGSGITTEDRTGLVAGVYTCTITDANGCLTTKTATITQPASVLAGSTVVANVSCFGGNNGAINLTPTGGTTPYIFNWGSGITTEDRTGLVAGVYTCTITDANACLTTVTATVTQPAALLTGSTVVTNVSCFGGNNGAINLTPTGGTTPYTFNWGGGITTEDRTGLVAGAYTCTITDVNTCSVSVSANVIEPSALIANAVVSTSINCNGGTGVVTVNASGGTPSYSGTGTYTVVAGTYTYTVTDFNGCVKTTTINVTQPAALGITVSSSTSSICVGATASLTATGASTYTWNPGLLTGSTVTVNPTSTTVYTATGTSSLGCVATKTINLVVNTNPTVTAIASSSVICFGASSTLSGSGATSYTWNPGAITSSNTVVSPTVTTNYTLTGVNAAGCSNTKTLSLIVNANPTVSVVSSPTVICVGATATLTAGGATSYLWNTGATTASVTTTPTVTTTYTVTGTNAVGCSKTQTLNLVVNSLPSLTLSSSSSSICNSFSATLTGTGASSYTWNPGSLTNSVVNVSPTTTTDYTLTAINANGCVGTETINITVFSNPTVTAVSSSSAICVGQTATLTASGANTYSWSSGSSNATEVVTPSSSATYTVVGTDAVGCINTATVNLTTNTLPVLNINPSSSVVCSGSLVTFTASGADTYTWSTNETTSIIEVVPSISSGYTVTGTDALGCVNTGTASLSVNTLPILSLTASPSSVCAGNSSTLTATGANTYIWNTGSSSASLIDNPTITTIYTVTGTDVNGCVSTETINVTVNALPTLTVTKSSNAVCVGHSATLTALGASTYSWSTGATISSEVVTPTVTTIYTVTGTDAIGCSSSDTVRIFANVLPNILTNVNTNTICLGGTVIFSNSGANTFTLSPTALTGSVISVPINTLGLTVFSVSGTGPLGCLNTKTISVTGYALPTVTITPSTATICSGQSVNLNATGANTYTWSGTGTVSNSISVSPSANTTYSLIGSDINGCANSATANVNVANTPTVSVSSPSTNVCMGYTMNVTASGASSYTWSTGANTNSITIQPIVNTTYSVMGSNGGTCTDTVLLSINVLPLPSVSASVSNTVVCSGQSVNLSATGSATAYVWSPGTLIGANQSVQITSPTTYTVYGQGTNGCAFLSTVFIDVKSGVSVSAITSPSVICVGDSATLSVIGGSVPSWSTNIVPTISVVSPLTPTTYTFAAVDINGCSSVVEFIVGIDPDCNIIIYNGFTPNGDGINDFWIIDNIDKYPDNKVYIYNRWGNEIYSTKKYNNTSNVWDGRMNGQVITSGTYFFVIVDGSEKLIKKGWIEITN